MEKTSLDIQYNRVTKEKVTLKFKELAEEIFIDKYTKLLYTIL